jgi:hypothetical protein
MATYKHLRSSTANKRPTTSITDGQLAINTNTASPGLFFKDSAGTGIVKVGPVHVGTTAPNATPAAGGSSGNYLGEQWLDTSVSPAQMKVWNGSAWVGVVADELPVSKLQDGAARQLLQTDAAGTGVEWTSNVDVPGTLDVTGATTLDSTLTVPLGSAASPTLRFSGDANSGLYSPGADQVAISTGGSARLTITSDGDIRTTWGNDRFLGSYFNSSYYQGLIFDGGTSKNLKIVNRSGDTSADIVFLNAINGTPTEKLRITSAGLVGIGTSSPASKLVVSNAGAEGWELGSTSGTVELAGYNRSTSARSPMKVIGQTFLVQTGNPSLVNGLYQDSSGRVGIGTTSPGTPLHIASQYPSIRLQSNTGSYQQRSTVGQFDNIMYIECDNDNAVASSAMAFTIDNGEAMRIDSSKRLLVGTSSDLSGGDADARLQVNGDAGAQVLLSRQDFGALTAGTLIGEVVFRSQASGVSETSALIKCEADATQGSGDKPGRLVFSTTEDGASSPTEWMRITSTGAVLFIKQVRDYTTEGIVLAQGAISGTDTSFVTNGGSVVTFSRGTNDGTILSLRQAGTEEGTISVSGTTVSYNGAHLSRWSQLASGAERTEILRGSILSNLDEMCEWGEEDNEQLNRMKVSTVEGDKNVSGVFQCWDDDDDTYTNDFYCAMTGDFIIRVAEGVTVERGDLLMSAGDGTAKPQDDDIIRSKTIAKVTSTNVSCTYADGSYCVPCVLMAC